MLLHLHHLPPLLLLQGRPGQVEKNLKIFLGLVFRLSWIGPTLLLRTLAIIWDFSLRFPMKPISI